MATNHQLDVEQIRLRLAAYPVHYFATTTTTMAEAARLAAQNAPAGTLVLADRQTAGRGRMGRAWYSEAGAGLYLTMILRPTHTVPMLTLAAGLAVHAALAEAMGSADRLDIRWPNDVLVDGRKAAGVLVTSDGESVLVGVGVNVNHGEFPPELAEIATSLRVALGRMCSREAVAASLAEHLLQAAEWNAAEVATRFEACSSYVRGKRIATEDGQLSGVTCGLDAEGYLLVQTEGGSIERVVAGGVRPVQ